MREVCLSNVLVFFSIFLIFAAVVGFSTWYFFLRVKKPIKIGVLYDLSGPDSILVDETLNWAKEKINKEGGINGHPVELIYKDTYKIDLNTAAADLLADKEIKAVIGPETSEGVCSIAPKFIEAKKILISPSATAGDIHRMFGKKRYFWRTCQGDVAQIRTILYLLKQKGVQKISLIYEDTLYGKTFKDWVGFFAIEMDMDLLHIASFATNSEIDKSVSNALESTPEYIIAVAFSEDAVMIQKAVEQRNIKTKVFFTDAAETQYVVDNIGLGTELISPAADPSSGFDEAYKEEFGYLPYDYSAHVYDAFLLACYAHARQVYAQQHFQFENFADSFLKIVYSKGEQIAWDKSGQAIEQILRGELPDIKGVSGELNFDQEFGVDPLQSYYAYNRVEQRGEVTDFWTISVFDSSKSLGAGQLPAGVSAARTKASLAKQEKINLNKEDLVQNLTEKEDLWAVIAATSAGWENYRHQADALRVYSLLKENGVSDKKIILLSVDDVPWLEENPLAGNIHCLPEGENLRAQAVIDYKGEEVTNSNLKNILLGKKTEETNTVLNSKSGSNILLYFIDHGIPGGLLFNFGNPFYKEELAQIVEQMAEKNMFRKMLIVGETCFGKSFGEDLQTANVLYLTSSAEGESSFGANYDNTINQWLADDFTMQLVSEIVKDSEISISKLYTTVYSQTIGSHPQLLNYENFGTLSIPIKQFVSP